MHSWIMTQDQNKDGKKYSFIIYWTIAQKLNIMNQTTNFTILIRIWNHDFYITQKSNFCTAGHKYLNKMGLFCGKHISSNRFLFSTQAVLLDFWSNVDVISLRLRWLYYRSDWQNAWIKRGTSLIEKYEENKKKQKRLYLFTLVPVVQLVAC